MDLSKFIVKEDSKLSLKKHHTDQTPGAKEKRDAEEDLATNIARLRDLQDVLYASDQHALLLIFQGMDASGKDGAIEHVMSGVNPQGCHVTSFKQPSSEEREHDYLWRHQKALPARGMIGIHNRSHYEEVLVVRVHPQILANSQLPDDVKNDRKIWEKRFRHIRDWETHLTQNGTHILKFFLHISREEQKKRFMARIEDPAKNWKFAMGDVNERGYWDQYMAAYEDALSQTSTEQAPWYVIPADKKWYARLAISNAIIRKLESLDLKYPTVSPEHKADIEKARQMLAAEKS